MKLILYATRIPFTLLFPLPQGALRIEATTQYQHFPHLWVSIIVTTISVTRPVPLDLVVHT